jgi:hypothetical protein
MKTLSRIATACGCAALVIVLAGCRSPIMTDRWAANDTGSSAQQVESGIRHWI